MSYPCLPDLILYPYLSRIDVLILFIPLADCLFRIYFIFLKGNSESYPTYPYPTYPCHTSTVETLLLLERRLLTFEGTSRQQSHGPGSNLVLSQGILAIAT